MSAHRGFRGALSALLASALVVGGALLTAPAASAEEAAPGDQTVQTVPETQAPAEAPAEPTQPEAPGAPEQPAAPEAPSTPEAPAAESPAEAPAAESPAEAPAVESPAAPEDASTEPALTVSPSSGLSDGDTVTVRGTGYNPAQAIYVTTCMDVPLEEVDFAFINNGCADGAKLVWQHGSGRGLEFAADGSFEVEMAVTERAGSTAMYTIANHTAMQDRSQDAKAPLEFKAAEPAGPQGTATVSAATENSLTVSASLTGVDPASQPNGVHVGVVLRGTADGATQSDFLGATASVKSVPESGEFDAEVTIPGEQLDRSQQYEVVVWPRRSNPSAANIVKVLEFEVTEAQWDAVFPPAAPQATVTADVASAAEGELSIAAKAEGVTLRTDGTQVPDTGKPDAGVYFSVIEKGTSDELAAGGQGLKAAFVWKGMMNGDVAEATIELEAAQLDRTKEYEVYSWRAHGNMTPERLLGSSALEITEEQWDAVFPPAPAGEAKVLGASEAGLSLTANLTGLDPEKLPNGVYVGLIEAGSAESATIDTILGTKWVRSIPSDGAVSQALTVGADQLDRAKQYEVLVWKGHTNPGADTNVLVLPLEVTEAQWDDVFPPQPAGPRGEAEVTAATAAGLSLTAKLTGLDPAELPQGAYVGLIEAGTAESATTDTIRGTMWIRTIPAEGEVNPALTVPADQLDRTKQYEVLVWKGHTNPSAETNILVLPLQVSEKHWDAIFGPVDPDKTHISARIAKVEPGKHITVGIEGTNLPADAKNAYVAIIEEGTAGELVDQETADYVAMEPFAEVRAGKLKMNLNAPAAKLVEGKRYEVLVWKQHSVATPQNIYGSAALGITQTDWDKLFSREVVKPQPKPTPRPAVTGGAEQAGSLTWGVSSRFAAYVTGPIAKGTVSTSGVGGGPGGYVFPQATGGSWNKTSQTGSVRYSGVVTFTGHKGQLNEVYANPVITVTSASSGTISAGGHSYGLNLAAGSKSVGPNGEVTWSGVPVQGAISGGGNGGGGSLPIDPISFTVGAASGASYGSTSVGAETKKRTAAETPPATTGIRVITPAEDIVPGGEIEFEASGFESKERDVLVVLYSDPVVLDDAAGANANGVVRWIGNLPEDTELGEHTITLQGSVDAGAVIEVVEPEEEKDATGSKERVAALDAESLGESAPQSAGVAEGAPGWLWWAGAIALLAVAGAMSGLVVVQRRNNS
ncbi:HtaA domain-containing protein [Leucobacter sp. CSA1]|uniref:HtaA domain-containing protein n=1 Tax=Leucobacter chromiisoli TaxID=2796471 RepID=A0A934Q6R8_9MICO|nr:HtaA domain-containing protein [Leucobacter chromiisoli]MBK0417714.1 HtaA domain-containing protein [Leucobacter chromiisoli]